MQTLKQLAVEGLSHLRESGRETLAVDDDARRILREWIRTPASSHPSTGATGSSAASSAPSSASMPTMTASPAPRPRVTAQPLAPPPSANPPLPSPASPFPARTSVPGTVASVPGTVEEKLSYLRQRAQHWAPALRLGSLRNTMVFATGSPHARLMLVGEAPGYDEERLQEPFVGRAGQKLNQILSAMGLTRQEIYISNVCKFRPSMGPSQGTANRPPSEEEIAACLPLILAEIRAIRPACIVCLGGSSAKGLLGSASSVSSLRGRWLECQGIPVRVTYHPSYLLRNESLSARRAVWEDMLAAMEKLGLPISDKQRQYFLPH